MRHHFSRLYAVALLAAGLAVAATVPAQAVTPSVTTIPQVSVDDFYVPPTVLPANNGEVIRHESSEVTTLPFIGGPLPATAQRIMYRSTDTHDAPIAVTGTVFSPTAGWTGPGERPLVSYAVGTQGQGDQCAPSHLFNQGLEYESLFIAQILAKGIAVVVTDFEGLGTPSVHTYMNRLSQGHAVLDAARAAQQLPDTNIPADGRVGLYGYSQGGGAAASAAELAPSYAPELKLVGAAAGAPPADLAAVAGSVDATSIAGVIGYAINGLEQSYPELSAVHSLLNAKGNEMLEAVKGECIGETLFRFAFQQSSDYTLNQKPVTSFLSTEPFKSVVAAQLIGTLTPTAPVYIWQGVNDDVVPYAQSRQLAADWCDKGATVQFARLDLPEIFPKSVIGHLLPALFGSADALGWLNDRFMHSTAGAPTSSGATSSCGSLPSA